MIDSLQAQANKWKVTLMGDSDVGKTSLALRFTNDNFTSDYKSSIGLPDQERTIRIGGKAVKLQILGAAKQHLDTHAFIICFDITNKASFDSAKQTIISMKSYGCNGKYNKPLILVGTKSDLADRRVVTYEHAKQLADGSHIVYFETSAKENTNVDEVFLRVAKQIQHTLAPAQIDVTAERRVNINPVSAAGPRSGFFDRVREAARNVRDLFSSSSAAPDTNEHHCG